MSDQPQNDDDFLQRVVEAQKALEAWPGKDLDLISLLPDVGMCSLCWGAGRNPPPNHLIMLFCEHPALWVKSYQWDPEQGRLVVHNKFTADGTAMMDMAMGAAGIYLQRNHERREGLPPSITEEAFLMALGGGLAQSPDNIQRAHDCLWGVVTGEGPIGVPDRARPLAQAALEVLCWVLGHDHITTFTENLERFGWQDLQRDEGHTNDGQG